MNNNINLVSPDINNLSKQAKILRRFKIIATVIVIGVGITSIALFLLNRIFSPQAIIVQQDSVRASIAALQTKHAKILLLNQKLNDIFKILKSRTNYDLVLANILNQPGNDISVTSLSLNKKKISLVVSSFSLISINNFIDMLKGMVDKKQLLKNVTINNLSLNGKFGYFLSLDIELL